MTLELLSFIGMLPRHLLIEAMVQDVNLALGAKITNLEGEKKQCRRMSGLILKNDPKLKMGVSLFAGDTLATETGIITE